MDDALYDTSWSLFLIRISGLEANSRSLLRTLLLKANAGDSRADLNRLDAQLRDFLGSGGRPRYEDEDEREKIGSLRECEWKIEERAQGEDRNQRRHDVGSELQKLLITLTYDKTTYKFMIWSSGSTKTSIRQSRPPLLLLVKASNSLAKRVTNFLVETFNLDSIDPLKLPPSLLQRTLQTYLARVSSIAEPSHRNGDVDDDDSILIATRTNLAKVLKSTVGNIKLTISFSAASNITPHLRNVDIDITSETIAQLMQEAQSHSSMSASVLENLAHHIHQRTGLKIPVLKTKPQSEAGNDNMNRSADDEKEKLDSEEAVMRISKISCAAYALNCDGRLKFASKPIHGPSAERDHDRENVLTRANEELLIAVMEEIRHRNG